MQELRRLQAQLRRMPQNRSQAADCYRLSRKIERLKYQLALGLFPDVGIKTQRADSVTLLGRAIAIIPRGRPLLQQPQSADRL
jgi:hypothetical protein